MEDQNSPYEHRNWVIGFSRKIGITTSYLAELWALRDGLNICLSKHLLDVEVELDTKIVVDVLTSSHLPNLNQSLLMDECRQLATRFNRIRFKHCYCEANRCVDGLVRKGATQIADFVLFDSPPQDLETSFIYDFNGLYSIRHCTLSLLDS